MSSTILTLLTTLLLLLLTTTTTAFSLNQFQPIVSFPSACTAAYNTPINGCDSRDFSGGNPCSKDCITSLQEISVKINAACLGTRADPTTLIGLFFQGTGVSTLCPNVVAVSAGAGGSSDASIGESTLTAAAATSVESSIAAASSTSETTTTNSSSSKKATKTVTATTSSETAAQTSASPTSSPSKADTTSKSTTTTSTGLRGGFTTTAVNNGVASVVTDKAQQTANPDGFGGGGSPFEVGVNGASTLSACTLSTSLLFSFVAGMLLLLR